MKAFNLLSVLVIFLSAWNAFAQPFTLSTNQINIALAPGFDHATMQLGITPVGTGFDNALLQAASDSAWVSPSVDTTSGKLLLSFSTASLTAASYSATITLTQGTDSQTLFVSATGAALSVFKLIDDPYRSRVYGLSQQGLNLGSVVVLDPLAKTMVSNITVGRKPTGLAVSNDGTELFVINSVDETISVVDLNTLRLKETINVGAAFDNWGQTDTTANIATGPGDILYYTDGAWAPVLRVFKRSTGTVLQQTMIDASSGYGVGDFVLDSTKTSLYAWAQYGWSAGWAGSYVSKFNVSASGTLSFVQATSASYPTPLSRDPLETPVLIDNTNQSVFVKQWSVAANAITTVNRTFPTEVYSISPGGEIAVTSSNIVDTTTGNLLYSLPFTTTVQTVTSDYAALVLFNGTTRAFQFVDLFAAIGAPAMGRVLTPADGAVVFTPSKLQWSPVAGADSYRVYLGTSASAVATATTSSPEFQQQTSNPFLTLAGSLTLGQTYYWRFDAVNSVTGSTPGAVYSFTVSPVSISPAAITGSTVQGHSSFKQSISLDALTAGTAWQATADKPWISFTNASGTTPGSLEVIMDASALPAGVNTASITISNSNGTLGTLPVTLTVDALSLTQIRSDPQSKFVYAISENSSASTPTAYLLEIDSSTEKITRVLPVGSSVTDLAIHNAEGRIYVPNWMLGALRAIDKTSMTLVRTYAFNPFQGTGYGQGDVYRIAAGASGRLVVEDEDQWIDIKLFNTSSGTAIATTSQRQGGGAFDPTGRYYYHGDDNISNAAIHKFDTNGGVFTPLTQTRVSSYNYYGSRTVVVSESGNMVFWNGSCFDASLVEQWTMSNEVYSTTPDGRYAFGETGIFDTSTKQQALGMPATTRVSAFNSTSGKLVAQVGQGIAFFPFSSPLSLTAPVLSPSAATPTSVALSWQDLSLETGFTLQYRTQGAASWTNAATTPAQNTTTATISSLAQNTTYEFRIKADSPVVSSNWSNTVTVTTPVTPPTTPSIYSLNATSSSVALSWTDSDKENFFVLERQLANSASWTTLANIAQNVTSYVDTSVAMTTSYNYRIKAVFGTVESAYSTIVSVTTPAPQPPATPSGVLVRVVSASQLQISWGNVLNETGYIVERRTDDPLAWQQVGTTTADVTVFNDTTVTAGIQYWYRVTSVNAVGLSAASAVVSGTPVNLICIAQDDFDPGLESTVWSSVTSGAAVNGGPGFLGSNALWFGSTGTRAAATVPLNIIQTGYLEFKLRAGNQTVDGLTYWNNSETGETLVLEYSLDGTAWTTFQSINTVYPNYASWTSFFVQIPQAAVSSATRLRWRQLSNSGGTNDTWALEDLFIYSGAPPAPSSPPFILTSPNSSSDIAVLWSGVTGASSYVVERTLNGSTWVQIATTSVSQTYFTDSGLAPNTWYQYRIRAANAGGVSAPSSTSLATTLSRLAEWRLQNYGTTATTGSAASTAAGVDGIPNLAKYAFNMQSSDGITHVQPGTGNRGLPTTTVNPATQRLRVEFVRRTASSTPGVSYQVEFCSDLSSFAPAGSQVQVNAIDANFERVIWEDSVSLNDVPARFARVKIVESP